MTRAHGVSSDGDALRQVVRVVVVPARPRQEEAGTTTYALYAQVPDVVPLLRLAVVDADAVVALKGGRLATAYRRGKRKKEERKRRGGGREVGKGVRKLPQNTHRSLLRALVRAAAGRAVDGVLGVVRVADRGGEGSEGHESGDGGEGAHYGRSKVTECG